MSPMFQRSALAQRSNIWLTGWGFQGNPFDLCVAEQEGGILPACFADRHNVAELLDDSSYPKTTFLTAERGCGKTAARLMVSYVCHQGRLRGHVLPVDYTEFDYALDLAHRDPAQVTARHHSYAIVRNVLSALAVHVAPERVAALDPSDQSLLSACLSAFGDPLTRGRMRQVADRGQDLDPRGCTPLELMVAVIRLTARLGYRAVYVLVDRIDETYETACHGQPSARLLASLVASLPLLTLDNLAFKFFVPWESWQDLARTIGLRTDRMSFKRIIWSSDDLRAVLRMRLGHFSHGNIEDLAVLCAPDVRQQVTDVLIANAGESPRNLFRLGAEMFRQHANGAGDRKLISRAELDAALAQCLNERRQEQYFSGPLTSPAQVTCSGVVPRKGLYLDTGGQVWRDGQTIPPLSSLEHRLIAALYAAQGRVVCADDLVQQIWGRDGSGDEIRLRKLLARLRESIEPDPSKPRFVQNVRGRGYRLVNPPERTGTEPISPVLVEEQ